MAFLVVERGNSKDVGRKFLIEKDTVVIGRITPDNSPDVPLNDDYISRRHAEISFREDRFILVDLNSTNGTSLDDIRVDPEKPHELKHDSVIGLAVAAGDARVLLRFMSSPTVSTARIELDKTTENSLPKWLRVDEEKGEIWVDERPVNLSRKEYDLVVCLWNKVGKICDRNELISHVWPEVEDPGGVSDAAIDQLIHRLRLKIEPDPSQPTRLISRKGFGYMLV